MQIISFPISHMVTGVFLPPGGASISVVSPPKGVATIAQWIQRNSLGQEVVSTVPLTLHALHSGEPLRVTELTIRDADGGEAIECYFEALGHPLNGVLSYWRADPKEDEYRRVLRRIIESIRPSKR